MTDEKSIHDFDDPNDYYIYKINLKDKVIISRNKEIAKLQSQLKVMRDALEFYADKKNHEYMSEGVFCPTVIGKIARKALIIIPDLKPTQCDRCNFRIQAMRERGCVEIS